VISLAASSEVFLVAPGQRGWEAMAMLPPGVSRRRKSSSRSAGAVQNPRELTARMASKGPWRAGGSCSTVPRVSVTRPARMAAARFHDFGVARQGPWTTWVNVGAVGPGVLDEHREGYTSRLGPAAARG
jgi:hypothetical protein